MAKPNYRVKKYNSAERPSLKALVVWKDKADKRQRKFFETIKEAETFAQLRETELLNQGREVLGFPTWLRVSAQRCQEQLDAHSKTIDDATAFYLAHLEKQKASLPIEAAFAEYYRGKEAKGLSPDYLAHLRSIFGFFKAAFPGKIVSDFTVSEIEGWIASLDKAPGSRNAMLKYLSALFAWAKERGYCEKTRRAQSTSRSRSKVRSAFSRPRPWSRS